MLNHLKKFLKVDLRYKWLLINLVFGTFFMIAPYIYMVSPDQQVLTLKGMMILDKYNGHLTQHAHSVYLDPLLSFGIIGLACLVPYIYDNCKRLYKVKEHYSYIALVMGFIGVLLIHGILDYTIFWIHTGLFFLFVLSSFEMFETNRN